MSERKPCAEFQPALHAIVESFGGSVRRGQGVTTFVVGPPDERDVLGAIEEAVGHVRRRFVVDLGMPADIRADVVVVACTRRATFERVVKWLRRRFGCTFDTQSSSWYLPEHRCVISHLEDFVDFQESIRHEACHHFEELWLGQLAPPWASEGYAVFVSEVASPRLIELLRRHAWAVCSASLNERAIGLRELLGSRQLPMTSYTERAIHSRAALLVWMLHGHRRQRPDGWNLLRSTFRGDLRDVDRLTGAVEAVFGCSLEALERKCIAYAESLAAKL